LLDIHTTGHRRILSGDWKQRDIKTASAKSGDWIEDRFVLSHNADKVVAATSWPVSQSTERKIVALRGAAREKDFAGGNIQRLGD
jgi:hypothetical protein